MAEKTIQTRVMLKKDTLENFNSENPVLLDGEIAIVEETTNNESSYSLRVGDGTNNFQDLKSLDSVDSGLVEVGGENPPESKKIDLWINIQGESEITIPELNDETITSGTTWSSFKIDKNNIYCSDTPPIFDKPTDYKDKLWLDTYFSPPILKRWLGEDVSSDREYEESHNDSESKGQITFNTIQKTPLNIKLNIKAQQEKAAGSLLNKIPFIPAQTLTENGITCTYDGFGSFTLNGTATALSSFVFRFDEPIKIGSEPYYFHAGNNIAVSGVSFCYRTVRVMPNTDVYVNSEDITSPNFISASLTDFSGRYLSYISFHIDSGTILNNLILQPMILPTNEITEFNSTREIYGVDYISAFLKNNSNATINFLYDYYYLPQKIYGGTLDLTTGIATITHKEINPYNGEPIPGEWLSDRDIYQEGISPSIGAQVIYELETPIEEKVLNPITIKSTVGQHVLNCSSNNDTIESIELNYSTSGWEAIADLNFNSTNHKVLLYEEIEDLTSII